MKAKEFIPKEWVLVRPDSANKWCLARFSHLDNGVYMSVGGIGYQYCIPYNEETEHLLGTTDEYDESYQPKQGDFVTYVFFDGATFVVIYNKNDWYYASLTTRKVRPHEDLLYDFPFKKNYKERRPATDSEKQQLLDAMHKEGKDWDAAKKEIVEYKRRPNNNDKYYYVNASLKVDRVCWTDNLLDFQRYKAGNCFRTKEEAKAMADKFKKLLKGE